MKRCFSKTIAVLLSLTLLICTLALATPAQAATKKKKKADPLTHVSTVTHYEIDYQTKKWRKQSVYTYQYKKGFPTKIQMKEVGAEASDITTFQYTFRKNGTPLKMTAILSRLIRRALKTM